MPWSLFKPRVPKLLFKYCTATSYRIESIEADQIFLSHPGTFNDPWDLQLGIRPLKSNQLTKELLDIILNTPVTDHRFSEKIELKVSDYGPDMVRELLNHDHIDRMPFLDSGIHSFTAKPDSTLMWAHYAGNHSGMIISYHAGKRAEELESHGLYLIPVRYRRKIPRVEKQDILRKPLRSSQLMFETKGRDWHYEKEWRLVSGQGGRLIKSPFPIQFIYLGIKMPLEPKLRVFDICKSRGIGVFQGIHDPKRFVPAYIRIKTREIAEQLTPERVEDWSQEIFHAGPKI